MNRKLFLSAFLGLALWPCHTFAALTKTAEPTKSAEGYALTQLAPSSTEIEAKEAVHHSYTSKNQRIQELYTTLFMFPLELIQLIAQYERFLIPHQPIPSDKILSKNDIHVTALEMLPNGALAVGYSDGSIKIWGISGNLLKNEILLTTLTQSHAGPVHYLAWHYSLGKLLSASTSYKHPIARVRFNGDRLNMYSFLSNSSDEVGDNRIMLWQPFVATSPERIISPEKQHKCLTTCSRWFYQARRWCRPWEKNSTITTKRTFDLRAGAHVEEDDFWFDYSQEGHWKVDCPGSSRRTKEFELPHFCLIGCDDGSVIIQDKQTLKQITVKGHRAPVSAFCFWGSGDCFASGAEDGTIVLWSAVTGQKLYELRTDLPVRAMLMGVIINKLNLIVDSKDGLEMLALPEFEKA